jgi:hypothetical protein
MTRVQRGEVCVKFEKGSITMTDDPNKRQNDLNQTGEQGGQHQEGQQSGQQQQRNTDESSRKRPSQGGGTDVEQDQEKQDQGGQRRAS